MKINFNIDRNELERRMVEGFNTKSKVSAKYGGYGWYIRVGNKTFSNHLASAVQVDQDLDILEKYGFNVKDARTSIENDL